MLGVNLKIPFYSRFSFFFFLIIFFSNASAQIYDISIPPQGDDSYEYADFRIYFNDSLETIRGVYFFMHPWHGDSRNIVNDEMLIALCDSSGFALMGAHFDNMHMETGVGDAVIDAMNGFMEMTGRSELSFAPFFINGYSWGGQFAYHYTVWNPDRVIGFITQKGGYHDTTNAGDAISVPGLMFIGEEDLDYRITNLTDIFLDHRPLGAQWSLAVEQGSGHSQIQDWDLLNVFFTNTIQQRLPDSTTSNQSAELLPINDQVGWYGDQSTWQIGSYDCYNGVIDSSSWFPSQHVGELWQNFVSEGVVIDTIECEDGELNDSLLSFFPLQIGNKWQYYVDYYEDPDTISTYYTSIEVISDTVLPNNKHYFVLNNQLANSEFIRIDSSNQQVMGYNELFENECEDPEFILFDLDPDSNVYETCELANVDYFESIESVGLLGFSAESKYYSWFLGVMNYFQLSENFGVSKIILDEFGFVRYRLVAAEIDGLIYGDFIALNDEITFPTFFELFHPFPNPFNPTTTIRFNIPVEMQLITSLHIYDITGRLVETLIDGKMDPGKHKIKWEASNQPSGIYFAVLQSENFVQSQKLILLK